jgi:hypothetical protein
VGVGQPGVKRDHGGLQPEAGDEQAGGEPDGRTGFELREPVADQGHIEVSGQVVEQPDCEEHE